MSNYVDGIEFITMQCYKCSIPFGVTKDFYDRRLTDREYFYCPSGHGQHFIGKTEEQKLRDKLEAAQRKHEETLGQVSILRDQRDSVSRAHMKMRKRIAAGVCPCCNRTFTGFAAHMQQKHPEFNKSEQFKVMRELFGMTQMAVGAEVGLSASSVSYFERGYEVSPYIAARIHEWMEGMQA